VLTQPPPSAAVPAALALCPRPEHAAVVRDALARVVDLVVERLDGRLAGLVLAGSFARGDGTVVAAGDRLRVLGDIECLVVLATDADFHALRPVMPALAREASDLVADRLRVEIELGPVGPRYLPRRARPSIFVHDLVTHGKVLWGPPGLLGQVRPFRAAEIPREDAVALLFNRMVEQLEAYDRAASLDGEALEALAYQGLKLQLDVAGSALAFRGAHVARYADRPAAFAQLAAATPALSRLPGGFQAELAAAARAKAAPDEDTPLLPRGLTTAAERAWIRRRIEAAVPTTTAVLAWELGELLGASGDLPGLLRRYLRAQPYGRRVWDWAKIALHPRRSPLPVSWPRAARLFFRSTPRALLYTAAALACLDVADPSARTRTIDRLLFTHRRALAYGPEARRRAIVALWRWCVRNS
jgi:hypothetical protein